MNVKLLPSANKAPIKMSMKSFLRLQYIPNISKANTQKRKVVTTIADDKDTQLRVREGSKVKGRKKT